MIDPHSAAWSAIRIEGAYAALDSVVSVAVSPNRGALTLESRSGPKSGPRSRNPEYLTALDLLLSRLASISVRIDLIQVVSVPAMRRPVNERKLNLDFPIQLNPTSNTSALRVIITEAQRSVARGSHLTGKQGGNNTKRIQIDFSFDKTSLALGLDIHHLLVYGDRRRGS